MDATISPKVQETSGITPLGVAAPPRAGGIRISPINKRRWQNFKANRRGYWSLWLFAAMFLLSLFAEFIANDKPFLVKYAGQYYFPALFTYTETAFGGEFETAADYRDPYVQKLISDSAGYMVWPPIRYSYDTHNLDLPTPAPSKPTWLLTEKECQPVVERKGLRGCADLEWNWLGTDDQGRDVLVLLIISSVLVPGFFVLLGILMLFSWVALVGLVRAEFLRGRNFEYVQAARALGVSNAKIMFRHLLPNAMVATMTFLPFILSSSVMTLTALDFLGFGLPPGSPSLGELLSQGKANVQAPWLGFTGFFSVALMLSLLIFVGEAVRDAFDPRKTFR